MKVGRCSDVNGIDIRLQQFANTFCLPCAEVFGHLSVGLRIGIEYHRQFGIIGS